jgi:hypothetical protein
MTLPAQHIALRYFCEYLFDFSSTTIATNTETFLVWITVMKDQIIGRTTMYTHLSAQKTGDEHLTPSD